MVKTLINLIEPILNINNSSSRWLCHNCYINLIEGYLAIFMYYKIHLYLNLNLKAFKSFNY